MSFMIRFKIYITKTTVYLGNQINEYKEISNKYKRIRVLYYSDKGDAKI